MVKHDEILKGYVSEQIALEEHLCKIIEQQISEIDEAVFADAKNLLAQAHQVLEHHFIPLNELLDRLERDVVVSKNEVAGRNGKGGAPPLTREQSNLRTSKILRDDYSALNLITMSNTLLHTTALALGSQEVASIALKHLENLAPLVVRLGELIPEILARELRVTSPQIDPSIAQLALKNTRQAWRQLK